MGFSRALAAGSSGAGAATDLLGATFVQGMGKRAAATDLPDAPISDGMKKFLGPPAIVLGDNGGVSNSFCTKTLSAVAAAFITASVLSSITLWFIAGVRLFGVARLDSGGPLGASKKVVAA